MLPTRKEEADTTDNNDPANVAAWNGEYDPRNPKNWSKVRKVFIMAFVTFATLNDSFASTIFSPAVPHILDEFHISSAPLSSFLISVHAIGFTIGPVLCPVSEVYGRSPMMHASNVLMVVSAVICALSKNIGMLIAGRILMGMAASVPSVLGGGYIADLIPVGQRGWSFSIWAGGSTLGTVIGPIAGGYLAQEAGWRWTFWMEVIMSGLATIAALFILKETYEPVILRQTRQADLGKAVARPFRMLGKSPITIISTFYVTLAYVYMYFLITMFPSFFGERYGFSEGQIGLTYLGPGIGFISGQCIFGPFLDWYHKKQLLIHGTSLPEDRLKLLLPGNILMAAGFFWYGWSAQAHTHWVVPLAGTSFINLGIFCVYTSIMTYLTDSFELLAASAISANTIVRSILGAVLPLAAPALYERLQYGWGNSLLAFIAIGFLPTMVLFRRFGARLRVNPKFQID